jgi:hypothetical protein
MLDVLEEHASAMLLKAKVQGCRILKGAQYTPQDLLSLRRPTVYLKWGWLLNGGRTSEEAESHEQDCWVPAAIEFPLVRARVVCINH